MENSFDENVATLSILPIASDTLRQITATIQSQNNNELPMFIKQSFSSLHTLEHWTWKLFTEDSSTWIYDKDFIELLDSLASLNYSLIFISNDVEAEKKSSLLIPKSVTLIDQIFEQIQNKENANDPYFDVISRWFNNLSYLIHEHTQFELLPIIVHICQHIGHKYILTDQYRIYLSQLSESQLPISIFTSKQMFYIKTCSFLFRMYICTNIDKSPFTADDILNRYSTHYLEIIFVHSNTTSSWSQQLLTCIAHLMDFLCACCWWGSDKIMHVKKLYTCEKLFNDYIQCLIRIVDHTSFHDKITSQWSNDETILIDSILIFLMGSLLELQNLGCFIRSETNLSNTILEIAQKSTFDRISLCAYGILAETLTDEQLQQVKITHNITDFFFRILELAWGHPTQRHKRIPISQLLAGFLTLSKNDSIQQKAAKSNKMNLLIEMLDQYPITLNILWSLSFNTDIQSQLRTNRTFMNKLTFLKENCKDEKMLKITFGILWNLELNRIERPTSDPAVFDMMISYSHKDEVICKKIYEELRTSGYRVWIDFDQIHGNVMDAMAQAIEQSNTIIICMSEQYRRSNYCRAEAHYAFKRERRIVPILLQEHYEPDGWLLFLIGQLLYVDFTKYEFPRAMELLVAELQAPVIELDQRNDNRSGQTINGRFSIDGPKMPISFADWTQKNVQLWLIGENLQQMARLLVDFDGTNLISLSEFLSTFDPPTVLSHFQEESRRKLDENISVFELARFRTLLHQQHEQWINEKYLKREISHFPILSYCQIL